MLIMSTMDSVTDPNRGIWVLPAPAQLVGATADEVLEDVAEGERQADADDHQLHDADALAAQGSPEAGVEDVAEHPAQDHRERAAPARSGAGGRSNIRAITAPKVTISPCAKFERPVVPYTSETPDRREREQQAEVEAVHDAFDELVEEADRDPLSLTEEEVDDLRARECDLGFDGGRALGDDDTFGEGFFVESDRVRVLLGHSDLPLAVCIRLDVGLVAVAVDRDGDALERFAFEFHVAGEVEVVFCADLVSLSGCRRRRLHYQGAEQQRQKAESRA